ncbi:MAG: hypothetical protein JWP10_666, partial [Nocardioidaceae bacterium]|nr:hypothetical protein [Nocardioidaceae bacterium]
MASPSTTDEEFLLYRAGARTLGVPLLVFCAVAAVLTAAVWAVYLGDGPLGIWASVVLSVVLVVVCGAIGTATRRAWLRGPGQNVLYAKLDSLSVRRRNETVWAVDLKTAKSVHLTGTFGIDELFTLAHVNHLPRIVVDGPLQQSSPALLIWGKS